MSERVLVAGIGNIFLSDDGFGCEAARALASHPLPGHVRVVDYGVRGLHLAYDLLDGYAALVLIDAVPCGQGPGSVRVLEIGPEHLESPGGVDAHGMRPTEVLATVEALGGSPPRTFVVGCEPQTTEESIGLSAAVARSVDTATAAVHSLLAHELAAPASSRPASRASWKES